MLAPITIQELTPEIAAQARAIAQEQPYRASLAVDPDRVVWLEIGGRERIGLAYTPDDPDGPHWMISISRLDGRRVARPAVRNIVTMMIGTPARFELAPPIEGAPHLTLARVRAA